MAWLLTHRVRHLYVQFAWNISYPALLAAVAYLIEVGDGRLVGIASWLRLLRRDRDRLLDGRGLVRELSDVLFIGENAAAGWDNLSATR